MSDHADGKFGLSPPGDAAGSQYLAEAADPWKSTQ
jgi:hypothetical protein